MVAGSWLLTDVIMTQVVGLQAVVDVVFLLHLLQVVVLVWQPLAALVFPQVQHLPQLAGEGVGTYGLAN